MRRHTLPPPRDMRAGLESFAAAPAVAPHGAATSMVDGRGESGSYGAVARPVPGVPARGPRGSSVEASSAGAGAIEAGPMIPDGDAGHGLRPAHGTLRGPSPALPRLRHLFDPRTGWFRRLERQVNLYLSGHVYPHIPGIGLPYTVLLERHLTVSEADVRIAGLPRPFAGMKVLLMTDLHAGPFLPPPALRRTFERLLAEDPDLILLGGDLTTCRVEEIVPHLPAFASLAAPLGVFAVLGNHDHYTGDPEGVRRRLEEANVRVLHNASVVLERSGARLDLAGIDDLYRGRPDLDAALASTCVGRDAGGRSPVLLLSHNPDVFFDACRRGVSLVFSGHTHGGQIRIPGLPVLVRQSRFHLDEGRYAAGGAELIVSRGLGATGVPLRLACPPEAVLVRLHPA